MNTPPRQAVILAAGYGTRLEPLTRGTPKCLLPLWGRPIIDHTLTHLAAWGVRDVLVNLHHAPQPLFDHLRGLALGGLRVSCSYEPDILGTGGALRRAGWFPSGEAFWMVNGDIAFDLNPAPLLQAFRRQKAMAALWMTDAAGPRTVELMDVNGSRDVRPPRAGTERKGRASVPASRPSSQSGPVRTFKSNSPGAPGTYTFCGLQLVSPAILNHVPPRDFSTIIEAYERAQHKGANVIGVNVPGTRWVDIGTPEGLLTAHRSMPDLRGTSRAWRRNGVKTSGIVSIGANVLIARGARLHDAVIMDNARISAAADVHEAIVGPNVQVQGQVHRLAVTLTSAHDRELSAIAARLGWPAARVNIQPLAPRGSARSFIRMACGRRRALVIRYSLERPENARFAGHARFLARQKLSVPKILIDWPDQRICVVEDFGDNDLGSAVRQQSDAVILRLYRSVLDAVVRWHTVAGPAAHRQRLSLEPPFNPERFAWEHNLFRDHLVAGRVGLPPSAYRPAMRELRKIAGRLAREPLTLVHRDLQSSNVLLVNRRPAFIDFQGMRRGPAVYDLASLLADPYVMLSERVQVELLRHYADAAGVRHPERLADAFWHAVVQRLVQALGAYARLARLPGTGGFARHILPALDMLDRAMTHLYTGPHLPILLRELRAAESQRVSA